MQLAKEPYFMSNKDWYYYDEDDEIEEVGYQQPTEDGLVYTLEVDS